MRYVVTGGAGFIGSHLTRALIQAGHAVSIIDNLSTGKRSRLHPQATFHQVDIRSAADLGRILPGADGLFHLAALPRVLYSIEQPLETHDANVNGTLNVILAARQAGVKRIVYSSSSSAYGNPMRLPMDETMKPRPASPYGLQKYIGEEYMRLASMFWGIETVSLRYFNVYGPDMALEGAYVTVIAHFNRQKILGQPLSIVGDGSQTRDFTYVDDVVHANLLAMASQNVGKGEVINIGAGDNHSVNEIAKIIGGPVMNIRERIEPHDTRADNTLARTLLGWKPTVRFEEGITRTNVWFQEHTEDIRAALTTTAA